MSSMAREIIDRHARYGWSVPGGEWGIIQDQHRSQFREALDAGDEARVDAILNRFFQTLLATGLSSDPEEISSLSAMVVWRLALWTYVTGATPTDAERLRAPFAGSPCVVVSNDVPTAVDTPRFDYYASVIMQHDGDVVEIGGGYGGVALQLVRRGFDGTVYIVDIPATLYIAYYWLTDSGVDVGWHDDGREHAVVLVPDTELDAVGAVDIVFSAHTLSGMDTATSAAYLEWIGTLGADTFIHDDVDHAQTGVWFTEHFSETLARDLVPAGYVKTDETRVPWTGPQDRFVLTTYRRQA